jgi:beta-glucanase (GH16 family)
MKLAPLLLSILCAVSLHAGPPPGYTLVFSDNFTTVNVSNWGPIPPAKWIAHTPYNGDFGNALFTDPKYEGGPFHADAWGRLRIKQWYDPPTKAWRTGMLCSVDNKGNGFSQALGYWTCRMQMPRGIGCWPSFWLLGLNGMKHDGKPVAEVDAVEWYGNAPYIVRSAAAHIGKAWKSPLDPRVYFQDYAVLINSDYIHFYVNNTETWKIKTPPEALEPMYCMVDFGLGGGWPITGATTPNYLYVESVRCYAPPAGRTP